MPSTQRATRPVSGHGVLAEYVPPMPEQDTDRSRPPGAPYQSRHWPFAAGAALVSQEESQAIQEQWANFLENDATDKERAAFSRFAQQLVVARLDRVRTIEGQLHNLSASTLS